GVVKRNRRTSRFDAVIDLRSDRNETVARETHTRPDHGASKLENIRIAPDGRKAAFGFGQSYKCAHWTGIGWYINVRSFDNHVRILSQQEGCRYDQLKYGKLRKQSASSPVEAGSHSSNKSRPGFLVTETEELYLKRRPGIAIASYWHTLLVVAVMAANAVR